MEKNSIAGTFFGTNGQAGGGGFLCFEENVEDTNIVVVKSEKY